MGYWNGTLFVASAPWKFHLLGILVLYNYLSFFIVHISSVYWVRGLGWIYIIIIYFLFFIVVIQDIVLHPVMPCRMPLVQLVILCKLCDLRLWFLEWFLLIHWGRDKMEAVSQTTLSNAFSWIKMLEFRSRFHWSLFLRAQLTIIQHWFR